MGLQLPHTGPDQVSYCTMLKCKEFDIQNSNPPCVAGKGESVSIEKLNTYNAPDIKSESG